MSPLLGTRSVGRCRRPTDIPTCRLKKRRPQCPRPCCMCVRFQTVNMLCQSAWSSSYRSTTWWAMQIYCCDINWMKKKLHFGACQTCCSCWSLQQKQPESFLRNSNPNKRQARSQLGLLSWLVAMFVTKQVPEAANVGAAASSSSCQDCGPVRNLRCDSPDPYTPIYHKEHLRCTCNGYVYV